MIASAYFPPDFHHHFALTLCHVNLRCVCILEKRRIVKELRDAGVPGTVDISAINKLAEYVQQMDWERGSCLQDDTTHSGVITSDSIELAIAQLQGSSQAAEMVAVINAYEVPKISYDPVGRKLYADHQQRTLLAGAEAKHKLYTDRLYLIHQRMRRNRMFQQGNQIMKGATNIPTAHLSDLQSLKGIVGEARISAVLLDISNAETTAGFFTENCVVIAEGELGHDGVFHARALGFPPTQYVARPCLVGENCVVIAEGELGHDGVFHARALGFPPTEARSELPLAAQKLNFFGGAPLAGDELMMVEMEEMSHSEDRVIMLANVWLDKKEVMDDLNTVFQGYSGSDRVPPMFVLMGNFHSRASSAATPSGSDSIDFLEMRDHFNSLAALIDLHPSIKENSRFVFVPGPGDPGLGCILPQAPLPAFFTGELRKTLPNAVFASNPCRLRYFSQEIVLFRYDALKRLRRRCIVPPKMEGSRAGGSSQADTQGASDQDTAGGSAVSEEDEMFGHLALTLLQQSHLCPLPLLLQQSHLCPLPLLLQPIFWEADHALHLYPVPHAVMIADTSAQSEFTHEGCKVFNPGSFSSNQDNFDFSSCPTGGGDELWAALSGSNQANFAAYLPCKQHVEQCNLRAQGDEGAGAPEDDSDEYENGENSESLGIGEARNRRVVGG
eukprot:gene3761-13821_t